MDFVEWEVGVFERPKWYKSLRGIPIFGYFMPILRNAENGLKHLEWESKLVYDADCCDETDENFGKRLPRAIAAIEKRDLYLWWKNARPIRIDPMDLSGLTKYYDDERAANKSAFRNKTAAEIAEWRVLSDECERIEKMYDDEDEEALHRLIRVRQTMWT